MFLAFFFPCSPTMASCYSVVYLRVSMFRTKKTFMLMMILNGSSY